MWPFVVVLVAGCTVDDASVVADPNLQQPYLPDAERIVSVPVYGGTLESVPAIGGLVAADPEGNRLLRVKNGDEVIEVDLGDNARPFRVHVEDTQAWVTLRGTGELASIALGTMTLEWRTRICLEPRGVTRSPAGALVVACAGGELVEIDDEGNVLRLAVVESDLRDVVVGSFVGGDKLRVSRFATAEILLIDPDTLELEYRTSLVEGATAAWRMRAIDGDALVLHQRATTQPISMGAGNEYYNSGATNPCGTIVETDISYVSGGDVLGTEGLGLVNVGTDLAVAEDGTVAVASAGAGDGHPGVMTYSLELDLAGTSDDCELPLQERVLRTDGRAAAVAFDQAGELVVQSAAPLSIARAEEEGVLLAEPTDPSTEVVRLFHSNPSAAPGVSCASCHPEGHDDGNVWRFSGDALLEHRTMPLAGAILSRSPYHWDAALHGPAALMAETFVVGMGGTEPTPEESTALFAWLDGLRHVRAHPGADESMIEVGRAAFAKADCATCHAGAAFTTNMTAVVGRDTDPVKTPSLLGVGIRNDLLHDGCASDLDARFDSPCVQSGFDARAGASELQIVGGEDSHGIVSALTTEELEALKVYLRTL